MNQNSTTQASPAAESVFRGATDLRRVRAVATGEYAWIWHATAVLFVISAVIAPGTLARSSLLAMLPFAGILAIVSTGQTMVIQQRGLDMSSAGVVSLGGVAMAILSASTGSVLLGAGLAVLLGAVVGVVNGLLVTRINITPLIATLAVNAVVIGAVRSLTGNAPIAVAPSVQTFSHALIGGLPCSLLLAVGFVLVAWLVMRKTSTGRCFVAVGVNPRSAEAAGLRVTFYQIGAYVASGVCFAVGGILLAGFIGNASHTAGEDYLLPAIAAVVVGGTPFTGGRGSVVASAIAALFMAQLGQMVLALGAGVAVQLLVQAATIVTATAIRFLPHLLAWMQKRLAPTWH